MSTKCLSVLTQNVKHFSFVLMILGLMMIPLFPQDTSAQSANKLVKVTGYGSNPNEARNDAVRQALQETMRQLIVVDRVIKDDQIIRDKIMSTMNGYVENFKELSLKKEAQQIAVQAEVTVSPSRIENFIGTSIGGGGSVSGGALFAESQREIAQRKVRGELFDRLFRGFPSEVLEVKLVKINPSDGDPTVYIMDLKISFSKPWVHALKSMLRELSIGDWMENPRTRRIPRPPGSVMFQLHEGNTTQYPILPPGEYGALIQESLYSQDFISPLFSNSPEKRSKLLSSISSSSSDPSLVVAIEFIDERGLSAGIKNKCFNYAKREDRQSIKQKKGMADSTFLFPLNQSYYGAQLLGWSLDIDPIIQRISIPANAINVSAAKNVALLPFLLMYDSPNPHMVTDVLATEKVADICGEPMDRAVRKVMMQQKN